MKPFPTHQDRLPLLSIQDKAERHLLPDELSIEEIGTLLYEDKVDRHGFYYGITEACQTGEIKYSGDINSERVNYDKWAKAYRKEKFPDQHYELLDYPEKERIDSACLQAYWEIVDRDNFDIYRVISPANCLIHRDDLAEYLKTKELWPVTDCLLVHWWHDPAMDEAQAKSQTEGVDDNKESEIVTNAQIKKIFTKLGSEQWRGIFQRDFKEFNIGGKSKPQYKLSTVSDWLEKKGHYSPAEITTALKKYNEPPYEAKINNKSSKNKDFGHFLAATVKQK
jgi:hypothetical protein